MTKKPTSPFMLCVKNDGHPASLELCKVYRRLADAKAAAHRMIRIIDESGEDYLYPESFFVPVDLPRTVARLLPAKAKGA